MREREREIDREIERTRERPYVICTLQSLRAVCDFVFNARVEAKKTMGVFSLDRALMALPHESTPKKKGENRK